MSVKTVKNMAASVRQRILNKARAENRPFAELLQYFAMERFLYRLSKSTHADKFILKGALMLQAWKSPVTRPTLDIDMLGKAGNNKAKVVEQVRDICSFEAGADGLVFDLGSIRAEEITQEAEYKGLRILFTARLDTAKIPMQIDVGFGDAVYPGPEKIEIPSLLDFPSPGLMGYSRESAIAEKFNAIVSLGELNSRMKDFFDLWLLSRTFDFKGAELAEAIKRTLYNRGTELPAGITAFTESFIKAKAVQWNAFIRKLRMNEIPPEFAKVAGEIKIFLLPVVENLRKGTEFTDTWNPERNWYKPPRS
jgi:hypothetical protein